MPFGVSVDFVTAAQFGIFGRAWTTASRACLHQQRPDPRDSLFSGGEYSRLMGVLVTRPTALGLAAPHTTALFMYPTARELAPIIGAALGVPAIFHADTPIP